MAQIGPALTCNGYDAATGRCGSLSVPSYIPANDADAYLAGQYNHGAASVTDTAPAGPTWSDKIIGGIVAGFMHPFTIPTNASEAADLTSLANGIGSATKTANNITGAASGVSSLLGIVTDLPRLGTILIGGLLIAAGLFSLAGGGKIIQISRGG